MVGGVMRAVVMGSGSWGTAMAKVLVEAGTETILWSRRPELADAINQTHTNPDYLQDVTLPPELRASADLAEALDGADLVVCAVPSQSLRTSM